jgi:hypothetical protein
VLTIQGNTGGRDLMDRAAMNMMGRLGGGQLAPSAPSEVPPQADVAQLLAQAVKLTLQGGPAELAAWAQATQFLKANLDGGAQTPTEPTPMPPNPMGMAAQGIPQIGRPPR